jgi:ribosomal protein S12 methylthiotransferase
MVGKEIHVLVEGVSSESEYLIEGRWYGQAPGIDGVTYLTDGRARGLAGARRVSPRRADYDLAPPSSCR